MYGGFRYTSSSPAAPINFYFILFYFFQFDHHQQSNESKVKRIKKLWHVADLFCVDGAIFFLYLVVWLVIILLFLVFSGILANIMKAIVVTILVQAKAIILVVWWAVSQPILTVTDLGLILICGVSARPNVKRLVDLVYRLGILR